MTIDNLDAYVRSVWDWDRTTARKNAFGDIDGHREHRGHHLFISAKPSGYRWKRETSDRFDADWEAHERLTDNSNCTLLIVYGDPNSIEEMQVVTYQKRGKRFPANNQTLATFLDEWDRHAEQRPVPKRIRTIE